MKRRTFAAIALFFMAGNVSFANPIKTSDVQVLGPEEAISATLTADSAGILVLYISIHRRNSAGRPVTKPTAVQIFTSSGDSVSFTPRSQEFIGVSGVGGTSWALSYTVHSTNVPSLVRVSADYAGKLLSFRLQDYVP
jgi:hypothetical protein